MCIIPKINSDTKIEGLYNERTENGLRTGVN